jgi:hypothetical protein
MTTGTNAEKDSVGDDALVILNGGKIHHGRTQPETTPKSPDCKTTLLAESWLWLLVAEPAFSSNKVDSHNLSRANNSLSDLSTSQHHPSSVLEAQRRPPRRYRQGTEDNGGRVCTCGELSFVHYPSQLC